MPTTVVTGAVVTWDDPRYGPRIGVVTSVTTSKIEVTFDQLPTAQSFGVSENTLRRVRFNEEVVVVGAQRTGRLLGLVRESPPVWEVSFAGEVVRYPEERLRDLPITRPRAKAAATRVIAHAKTTLRDVVTYRERGERSRSKRSATDAAVQKWRRELNDRVASRSKIDGRINDERCGGDPAESEGSRKAMKDKLDNETRIGDLSERIREATGNRPELSFRSTVRLGVVVHVHFDGDPSDTARYVIGTSSFDDTIEHCNPESPLGLAVLGRHPGESVTYFTDRGVRIAVTIDKVIA